MYIERDWHRGKDSYREISFGYSFIVIGVVLNL
jgi:hypothetical protein